MAMLAFFPVPYGLLNGQDAILVLFFFTLVFAAFRKGRFASAGIFLGLGLFKFHFILPFLVLWLLQRRNVGERVRLLLGFISTAVVLALVSLKVAGVRSISAYPKYVLWWEDYMAGPDKVPAGMPSLRGLLYIFLPSGFDYHAILLILSIGLFAAVVWMSRRDSAARSLDLNFSLALLFTAVTSYHVVSYDLSMLLLSIGLTANYYLSDQGARGWPARAFLLCTCAMFFSPLQIYLSVVSKKYGLIAIVLLVWMLATGSELMQKKKATLIGNGAGAAS